MQKITFYLYLLTTVSILWSCKKTEDYEPLYDTPTFINQKSNTTNRLTGIQFVNENTGYISGRGGVVLKTTNAGATWAAQTIATTLNINSISFVDQQTGWVTGATGTVFKTTDGGTIWSAQTLPTTQTMNGVKFINPNRGFIVGAQGLIIETSDGGTTWTKHTNVDTLGMRDATVSRVLASGGTVTATTGVITATTLNYIYVLNKNTLFILGNAGQLFKSTDGGVSWKWQDTGNINSFYSMHFPSSNMGYICGANGTMLRTDGMGNFENATAKANTRSFRGVFFSSNMSGWAIGEHGYIFHTNDGGLYWGNEMKFDSIYIFYACAFTQSDTGYFVGNNGTIIKVKDIKRNN